VKRLTRGGESFFDRSRPFRSFVLDLLSRETASGRMYRPGHIRAVKIATVSRLRMERTDRKKRRLAGRLNDLPLAPTNSRSRAN
jgi:hypothetical protein